MMIDFVPHNPYSTDSAAPYTPFAGRANVFARLRRQLTDPAHSGALLITGRRQIGKTAFLRAFDSAFDETFVGVYVPLRETLPAREHDWWLGLAQSITERLVASSFTLTRLHDMQPPGDDARAWFAETYLPPVLALIRPHRRLVLLFDDAEVLLNAKRNNELRADTIPFLRGLTDRMAQLHIALTLDTAHEAALPEFYPLVRPTDSVRLTNLAADETAWLLSEPVREQYALDDGAQAAAFRLTGGAPAITQSFGILLYERYQDDRAQTIVTTDDVKRAGQILFRQIEGELRRTWDELTTNEQVVLRAVSQLLYQDPLRPVDANTVGSYLVDSDEPMDATTVGAALRSLEYREIVTLLPEGIALTADVMQRFLLENAYNVPLSAPPARGLGGMSPLLKRRNRGLRVALLLVLVAMLVVGVLLLSALSSLPREAEIIPGAPTITLTGG
ncbi:MAG: ATP-binding protein [Chloroflexota bacterium]|nr:ATP-binding protein [Chloroflexota bacterium]